MKGRCEEIVIERYLKGDISNEFKDALLWGINENRDNEQYLEVMCRVLKDDNNKDSLKVLETIVNKVTKEMVATSRDMSLKNSEELVNKLLEELEHELSK